MRALPATNRTLRLPEATASPAAEEARTALHRLAHLGLRLCQNAKGRKPLLGVVPWPLSLEADRTEAALEYE